MNLCHIKYDDDSYRNRVKDICFVDFFMIKIFQNSGDIRGTHFVSLISTVAGLLFKTKQDKTFVIGSLA